MSSSPLVGREDSAIIEGTGGMTLPVLLAIAIGGGLLLFICLAFLLVALASRRHRTKTLSPRCMSGEDDEVASDGGPPHTSSSSPRPRRLTKTQPRHGGHQTYMDMVEIHEQQPHRSLASIMSVPRSKTFNVFGAPAEAAEGQQRGGHMRRNHSWIDEDAIHGPKVQRDERRLSIRDSFILRTPTLPDMAGFKEEEAFADSRFHGDDHQQHPYIIQQPRPVSLPPQRSQQPRITIQTAASSYEHAEKMAAAARCSAPPGPQVQRVGSLQRLRHKTTESDLAEILRSTEERLQSVTPMNSRPATRQRANSASAGSSVLTPRGSPTKSQSPVKISSPVKAPPGSPTKPHSPIKFDSPVKRDMVVDQVGFAMGAFTQQQQQQQQPQQRMRTPSPQKRLSVVSAHTPDPRHKRNISQISITSDGDSLFGETTPEIENILSMGLTSPSRRSNDNSPANEAKPEDRCMSIGSLGSNASSSLSTLYSVNEPEDDSKTGGGGHGEGTVRGRKPKGLVIDTQICDPFITPPDVPPRSPKRLSASLPPLRRVTPPEEKTPVDCKSASNSPHPKRGSAADKNQPRLSILMHAPSLPPSPDTIRPKSVTSMKPVVLVSSATVVSMKASPGTSPEGNAQPETPTNKPNTGQKTNVFPPPMNLHPALESPTREVSVMESPEGNISLLGGSISPKIRPARNSLHGSGPASSPPRLPLPNPELHREPRNGSPTPGRHKRRGMRSPALGRTLSRQSSTSRDHRADYPSIILNPSGSPKRNSFHRDFAVMGLQSTVAQLRRMNSQMSTLSGGSSVSDPESPTLPNMRGGGFSPDRSNSRVSKIGRQNYLALGNPKAKRNTRSSIKGARNSIAVIKGRPGANARLETLRAAVEEQENEARVVGVVRGPRPLEPSPRSQRTITRETGSPEKSPGRSLGETYGGVSGLESETEASPSKLSPSRGGLMADAIGIVRF